MSDIFREVDEEFKRDKVAQFAKKHSGLILAVLLLVVAGVGGFRLYTYLETQKSAEAGKKFEDASQLLTDGKEAEAKAALTALAKDGPAGYRALAQFRLAGELAKTDAPGAVKAFEALAGEAALDPSLQDLARVRAATLLVDTAPFADIQARLEPQTAQAKAWRLAAREALAASAIKAQQTAKATQYLDAILADPEATRTQRERAEMMMALTLGGAVSGGAVSGGATPAAPK